MELDFADPLIEARKQLDALEHRARLEDFGMALHHLNVARGALQRIEEALKSAKDARAVNESRRTKGW
jgi:hypothetical protein